MTNPTPEPLTPAEVEDQLAEDLAAVTDARAAAILAAWVLAWSEISGELRDSLLEVMADGTAVTSAVLVRTERLQKALAMIADRLVDLAEDAGVTITSDLPGIVAQAAEGQARLMAAQVPDEDRRVELDLERLPERTALDAIVERFADRVTADTLPLADETYEVIQREVTRGIAVGDNPRTTAARIVDRAADHWNLGRARAENIARTEMLDAYRESARATQDEHADILAGWVWLAHLGPRTCRSCIANHGTVHDLDEPGPEDHQQGRCTRCPLVAEDDGSYDLSWVPDVEELLASLTAADLVQILGKSGFAAYQRGDFPRSAWSKRRSSDGWRDSMVPASPNDRRPVPIAG